MVVRELVTLLGFKLDDSDAKKYDKQIDKTKEKSNSLSNAAQGIGTAFKWGAAIAAVGTGFLMDKIVGVAAETGSFRVIIGALIGDQEKANRVIQELDYSPVSDFYGTAAAIGGLRSFVTMGMDIEKAKDQMTLLGDVAQGSKAAFDSLSANMAQVYSKGKADAMDLKQFTAQGFDVASILHLDEAQKKAGVSYAQVEEALRRVTSEGGAYHKMLEKQMNTVNGIMMQYKSMFSAIGDAIGTSILEPLKDVMRYVLNVGKAFQDKISAAGSKAFKYIIDRIADVIVWFQLMYEKLNENGTLDNLKKIFFDLREFVEPIVTKIKALLGDIIVNVLTLVGKAEPALKIILSLLEKFGPVILGGILAFKAGKGIISGVKDDIAAVKDVVGTLKNTFGQAAEAANLIKIGGINGHMLDESASSGNIFAKVMTKARDVFKGGWGIAKRIGEFIKLNAVLLVTKARTLAIAAAQKAQAAAAKIAAAAQMILNVIMSMNPIGLIIIAIVALIAIIVVCAVKFKSFRDILFKIGNAIAGFFKMIWEKIKAAFFAVVDWIKEKALAVWDGIKDGVSALVDGIVSIWNTVKDAFGAVFDWISGMAQGVWDGILAGVQWVVDKIMGFVDIIKGVWDSVTGFFGSIGEGAMKFLGLGGDDKNKNGAAATPTSGTLTANAANSAARNTVYNSAYNNTNNSPASTVNASMPITVNANGMTPEQAQSVIKKSVQDGLSDAINSSRAVVPSPEKRRY